jgi:hypothetical protein
MRKKAFFEINKTIWENIQIDGKNKALKLSCRATKTPFDRWKGVFLLKNLRFEN